MDHQTTEELKDLVYEKFLDSNGLMSGNGSKTGNGLRYTSEYLIGLERMKLYDYSDAYQFYPVIDSCMLATGLFSRDPSKVTDQQGPDDYIALVHLGVALKQKYHLWISQYGDAHEYVYLNAAPSVATIKSAWLGRFPQFIAHMEYALGKKPSRWQELVWCYSVAFSPKTDDQDSWVLAWHLKEVGKNLCGIIGKWACSYYEKRLRSTFPEGLGSVFARYFNNDQHPLAILYKGVF